MSAMQRTKGKAGERELCAILSQEFGQTYRRNLGQERDSGNDITLPKRNGRFVIEVLNRDDVIGELPTRVWWEGDGCVVLEEVEFNYFSSRINSNRSVVFDDGRQIEQEISVRAYSLHELGKLLHSAGFRVVEVSGSVHTRGRFFGNQSRHIIVVAEKKPKESAAELPAKLSAQSTAECPAERALSTTAEGSAQSPAQRALAQTASESAQSSNPAGCNDPGRPARRRGNWVRELRLLKRAHDVDL